MKSSCTSSKRGRIIERNEHAHCYEQNKRNIEANKELYKRRQAIVEHPFGTIKRQWGFSYILTKKGMQRASADVGFMFIAYILRRIIHIIGFKILLAYLKACIANFTPTLATGSIMLGIDANLEAGKLYVKKSSLLSYKILIFEM